MKKIKLKILGLSYSQSQEGSYVIVLAETKGGRKLPIIIKPHEAQYIALKMEKIEIHRPLTQDLFKSITDALEAEVQKVIINNLLEGIFYAKIILLSATGEHEIECSVGDALSVSILYKCPIYTNESVMGLAGILMDDNGVMTDEQKVENLGPRNIKAPITIENLEQMLNNAVENEEYEIASQIQERIKTLKESKND